MANRFTNFTPQQYVESFVETPTMDFPFQEAMMIEGIKEKRNNELAGKIGALDAIDPQAGYLTEDLKKSYIADKQKAITDLQTIVSDPNIPNSLKNQEVMKQASRFKNDPRVPMMQQDFELKPYITKGMFEKGYGVDSFYAGMNPQTIQDIKEGKITSIDATTYDGIIDPGKTAAFKPTLEMVVADSFSDYTSTKNADGTMSLKSADKSLDMNTFMNRTEPFRDAMTNEDGSIKINEGLTPDMKMFIKANMVRAAQQGKTYMREDFDEDMKDVASLMLNINRTTASTEKDATDGGDKGKPVGILGDDMVNTTYMPPVEDTKIENASSAQKTTGIVREGNDHFVVVDDGKGNITKTNLNSSISSDFETRRLAASELKNAIYEREKNSYMSGIIEKERGGVKVLLKDGKIITQEQINNEIINNSNDRYIQSLKYAQALHNTEIELLSKNLSPEELSPTAAEQKIIDSWEPTVEYPVINPLTYRTEIQKYANTKYPKGFVMSNGKLVPERTKEYDITLDKNIKESFANTEISTKGIVLFNKEEWNSVTDIPETHQRLRSGVQSMINSETPGFSYNGKSYESFWKEDSPKGQNIKSLKLSGGDDYGDFSNGTFNANQIIWDPTNRNGTNGKWIARGNFLGTKKDGDKVTDIVSEPIDYDVTQYMRDNILTSGENQSVLVTDMALDIVSNTPKGLGGIAPTGLTPEEEKKYGEIYVNRNLDNTYSIYGNTVSNGKTISIETPDFIKNYGEEYGITSNKNLNQSTAIDVLGKMIHTRYKDVQKGESTPEQQVYENLPVSEERLPSVQAAFQAIENNESATYGGYDAMNTGGGADGKTAYGSSTGTEVFKTPLTKLTVGQIKNLQSSDGKKKELHAAGKFQITPKTLLSVTEQLGLSDSDLFNEETQLKMGNFLFEETVKNAADQAIKEGYSITETEIFNRLFTKGKKFEDSGNPTGWMVHQWRGLENAKGDEKRAILTAATQYLKEKGYEIYKR